MEPVVTVICESPLNNINLRRFSYAVILAGAGILMPAGVVTAASMQLAKVDATALSFLSEDESVPVDTGECYARVRVPPVFSVVSVEVVVTEASNRFEISAARLESRRRRVITRDASTKLKPFQPVVKVEARELELAAASSRWVRSGLDGTMPMSAGDQRDLELAGVDYSALAAGSCLYEHYRHDTHIQVPHQLLIREARQVLTVTPAKFIDTVELVTLKPAYTRLIEVPAVFSTVQQRVLTQAFDTNWEPGPGAIQFIDELTGATRHRVDKPAQYKLLEKQVVETPAMLTRVALPARLKRLAVKRLQADAREQTRTIPAVFETVYKPRLEAVGAYSWLEHLTDNAVSDGEPTGRVLCHRTVPAIVHHYQRTVVQTPGRFERELLPVQFDDMEVAELIAPAHGDELAVPAETKQVVRRKEIRGKRMEWHPVVCKSHITRPLVRQLQQSLLREGFSPGPIDGLLGRGTNGAVERFQKDRDLAQGGLTLDTFSALGISY